jgi:hypothetical protein
MDNKSLTKFIDTSLLNKKTLIPLGTNVFARGATPVRLTAFYLLISATFVKASLTCLRYSKVRIDLIYTFYLDNGGNSGSSYSDPRIISPYNSEAHSVLACIQDSQHRLFSVPQYQRLLALFTVFIYTINEIIRQENLLSSSLADRQFS